jgi:hypothetical protein
VYRIYGTPRLFQLKAGKMSEARNSVIERHERWPATLSLEYPNTAFEVREIGSGGEVLLRRISRSPPAAEPLNDGVRSRFGGNAEERFTVIHDPTHDIPPYAHGQLAG